MAFFPEQKVWQSQGFEMRERGGKHQIKPVWFKPTELPPSPGCFLCLGRENPTWISWVNSEREQSKASNTQNIRMEISSCTNGVWRRALNVLVVGPGCNSGQNIPAPGASSPLSAPSRSSSVVGSGFRGNEATAPQKEIECHGEQMLLFPPKIYTVSSASQRAVVSSDGQLGRVTSIC